MPTVMTREIEGYFCKEVLAELDKHAEDGWVFTAKVENSAASVAIYNNLSKPRVVQYHAMCCGVVKLGYFELEGPPSLADFKCIQDGIHKLMQEFIAWSLEEQKFMNTRCVQEKVSNAFLHQ